ncbi:Phage protein [Escherichia phage rV5_ev147]|nr:Phage protein [Escherichia phage rV5_ev147]VVA46337.1 Phage protein [Escherichia phage rV5_ev156]
MIIILVCRITGTPGDCLPAPTAPACYYSNTQDKESKKFLHKFLDDNDNRSHFMQRPSPVVVSPSPVPAVLSIGILCHLAGPLSTLFKKIFLT